MQTEPLLRVEFILNRDVKFANYEGKTDTFVLQLVYILRIFQCLQELFECQRDSGSSAHSGRAGSSPASRTKKSSRKSENLGFSGTFVILKKQTEICSRRCVEFVLSWGQNRDESFRAGLLDGQLMLDE